MPRSQGRRPNGVGEDDAGLAGWLYTDLLLGLAVVFLAGTSFFVPRILAEENPEVDEGTEDIFPETTTTTTTTIPVDLCTSLYTVDGAQDKEDGIWVLVDRGQSQEAIVEQFLSSLAFELGQENNALIAAGKQPFDVSTLRVGLMLVYGGYPSGGDPNRGQLDARSLFENDLVSTRASYLFQADDRFPASIQRFFGTRKGVGQNQVGFDVFPYIESPC